MITLEISVIVRTLLFDEVNFTKGAGMWRSSRAYFLRRIHLLNLGWLNAVFFFCGGCQTTELTSAKVHIQKNDWDKAVVALEKTVAENPKNAEAQFLLGRGYAAQKRFANMNRAFAASLIASSQFENEINAWRKKYFAEYFNAGVKAAGENNFPAAGEAFATAAVIDSNQPEAYQNLAYVYAKSGELEQALAFYQQTLDRDPANWEASAALADIHNQRHEYEKSLAVLEQAVQKNPRQPQILAALAAVYDCLGKNDEALAAYQQALQNVPDNKELLLDLARLYLAKNDYAHAIQQYASVLSLAADDFEANYHIGLGYLKMGERLQKRAGELAERQTAKFFAGTEEKTARNFFADSSESARLNLETIRNFKTAMPFLLKATKLDTLHAGAYFNLGVGFTRLGEIEKAKEAFKRSEQLQEKSNQAGKPN
jgi:tetratricopeptide (TPR) repeat protein